MKYMLLKGEYEGGFSVYQTNSSRDLSLLDSITYGEFFKRLRDAVKAKSSLEDMKLADGNLTIDLFSSEKVTIGFSTELWHDESFRGTLEDILAEYKEVSLETKRNIEEKKRTIQERKRFEEEVFRSLNEYLKTGKFGENRDGKFMSAFIDYIDKNKGKIKSGLEGEGLKSRHPHFMRFYKVMKFLSVPAFLTLLVSFVCSIILPVLIFIADMHLPFIISLVLMIISGSVFGLDIILDKTRKKYVNDLYRILVKKAEIEKEKIESMEKSIENDSLQQDIFLKYISRASFYMLEHNDLDFSNEARELSLLLHSYADAKKEEIAQKARVDRFKVLGELTKLEIAIYSKNNNKRFLTDYLAKGLDDRLEFLGIAKNVVLSDSALNDVFKTIKRILNFPYDGFDDDIMELIKMSQEYVEETKKDETPRGLGYTEASVKLINRLALLTCEIDKRVSSYIDSVNLDGDLAAIQGCIEAVGIAPTEEVARGENTGTAVHM